jgi:hypothetical protein
MTKNGKLLLAAAVAIVLTGAAGYYLTGHRAPEGQAPLIDLNAQSLDQMKDEFNRVADRSRVILLLSPT